MPAISRVTDMSTGHDNCGPRPSIQGSPDVFINGLPVNRVGDQWAEHCNHGGSTIQGSANVFVNGMPVGRVGDPIDCGDTIAQGSPNVFVN